LYQFEEIAKSEELIDINLLTNKELFRKIKSEGFSDAMIAKLINRKESINLIEDNIYSARRELGVRLEYNEVDTCSAEFKALTPYLYSTTNITELPTSKYEDKSSRKVLVIGGGPNRIGQGIEFDYCCVHASFALEDMGIKSIMYNCNPETVSTDSRYIRYPLL